MPERITLRVDDSEVSVPKGTIVAAAILNSDRVKTRRSVVGEARGPLCGMGICYECHAKIDGVAHARSCMIVCQPGMVVETDA